MASSHGCSQCGLDGICPTWGAPLWLGTLPASPQLSRVLKWITLTSEVFPFWALLEGKEKNQQLGSSRKGHRVRSKKWPSDHFKHLVSSFCNIDEALRCPTRKGTVWTHSRRISTNTNQNKSTDAQTYQTELYHSVLFFSDIDLRTVTRTCWSP